MKKALAATLVALAVTASSCAVVDSLFYNADGVKASELDDFTGSAAANEAEAKAAVIAGIESGALPVAEFAVSGPSGDVIARAFPRLMPAYSEVDEGAAASRAAPTATFNSDGSVTMDWSSDGEIVSSDPTVTLSGSLAYSVSADTDEDLTSVAIDASLKADLTAEIGPYAAAGLKGAIMNLKAKGDAALTGSVSGFTAKGYAALSLNAGMSLDEAAGHKGGKYIVSAKFTESYDMAVTMTDIAGSAANEVAMTVVVKVYDNDNTKMAEYEFTAEDFADALF